MKKVVVIVGPTGSGKTGLSIKLAKKFNHEIINGDSVQVYKRLNIGSAKITNDEMQGIKHHLLDIREPNQNYSVYEFQNDVRTLLEQNKQYMICGGTGLYIKAALYDYNFDEDERDPNFDLSYQDVSTEKIAYELLMIDPLINIDFKNRRRVLRALEQAKHGHHRSSKNQKDELLYDVLIIYLDIPRDILEERLKIRLEKQLNDGFIDEVKSLLNDGIKINAIGYKELNSYLDHQITLEEAKNLIIKNSRKLAKKQKTWFKNQMQVVMLDALDEDLFNKAEKLVSAFMKE